MNTKRKVIVLALAMVALAGMATTLVEARSLQLYTGCGLNYLGHWVYNTEDASSVKVRVQYRGPYPYENITVQFSARAEDGTTVSGSAVGRLYRGQTRDFTIAVSKPITELHFLQIRSLGSPTNNHAK